MACNLVPCLVAVLVVLSALGGLALPAKAALVYTGCLADATNLVGENARPISAPRSDPAGIACVDDTRPGGFPHGGAPANEYLDPVSHVVYRQTPAGLQPIGLGSNAGYLELQTQTNHANGDQCSDSVSDALCTKPLMDCHDAPAFCQSLRIALTGCHHVWLDVQYFLAPVDGGVQEAIKDYPQPCPPTPLGILGPTVDWATGGSAAVTVIKDDDSGSPPFGYCEYSRANGVPLAVTTILKVDGNPVGSTKVTLPQC